jgi:hypothetical protein
VTNTSPDAYTEGLNVTRGATAAGFTSSGSVTNLVAGGSSSALGVALNTSAAGSFTGSQVLNLASNGSLTNNSDLTLGSSNVNLTGNVYTVASASVAPTTLNFGVVHVGDVVGAQNVGVTNTAQVTALNDTLTGSFGGASGPFAASGSLSGVAAQATDGTSLKASLNTATAGVYNSTGFVNLQSHDADLADVNLGSTAVNLQATVNNYAKPVFEFDTGVGSLSGSGTTYTLNFGTVTQGSGSLTADLDVTNLTNGPSDLLKGSFCLPGQGCSTDAFIDFLLSGFSTFQGLGAGQSTGLLSVGFDTTTLGLFQDTITLASAGYNSSGYDNPFADITLIIQGNVVSSQQNNVPEPGSLALGMTGLLLLWGLRRKQSKATLRR